MADKESYDDYVVKKRVKDAEGEQFMDDVRRGPPYTSRGFAMGHNEGRVERRKPDFIKNYCKGGKVIKSSKW